MYVLFVADTKKPTMAINQMGMPMQGMQQQVGINIIVIIRINWFWRDILHDWCEDKKWMM